MCIDTIFISAYGKIWLFLLLLFSTIQLGCNNENKNTVKYIKQNDGLVRDTIYIKDTIYIFKNVKNEMPPITNDSIDFILSYKINGENKLFENSIYDIELKPKNLELLSNNISHIDSKIVLVDLYRIFLKENDTLFHFYSSIAVKKDMFVDNKTHFSPAINIENMMQDNNQRFYKTIGFQLRICLIDKRQYIHIKDRSDCESSEVLNVFYPDSDL